MLIDSRPCRAWLLAAALIAAVLGAWLAFPPTGFYQDDWFTMEDSARGRTLLDAVHAFAARGWNWRRPAQIVLMPLAHRAALNRPAVAAGILAFLVALEALLLYGLVRRMTGRAATALAVTGFVLLYPGRPSFQMWFADILQTTAQPLVLGGLWLYRDWVESRRPARLFLALGLYLAGASCYEAAFFLPLILLADPAILPGAGPWRMRLRRVAARTWPLALAMAAAVLWNQVILAWITSTALRPPSWSLGLALKGLGAGFECVSSRVLHECLRSVGPALRGFSAGHWLLAAALAIFFAWALESALRREAEALPTTWWVGTAAAFLGAYLPYAFSGGYQPTMHGIMSRTNGAGAWVFGMLAAGILASWPASWSRFRPWCLGLAAMLLLPANWTQRQDWARAWREQQRILDDIRIQAKDIPGPATIVLSSSLYVGDVVVFDAPYDFDSALHLAINRKDLTGAIDSWRFRFRPDRALEAPGGQFVREYSYDRMFLYDPQTRELLRVSGPPDARWAKEHPARLIQL
ncbi:MAG TPA: hypothetical protein DEB40_00140 [Elusimicrobia bacterium]|nr:hypothetical protein [Elusimicrobiota bacterium]HBT60142.1 hypothetical protein [Elusimicrobiota bacterium]